MKIQIKFRKKREKLVLAIVFGFWAFLKGKKMDLRQYKHPIVFYVLSLVTAWLFWGMAGYISHRPNHTTGALEGGLCLAGLAAPALIALVMMASNKNLRLDLKVRLFGFSQTKLWYWFFALTFMLLSILIAQWISLLFGYSADQFSFSSGTSFQFVLFPAWIMLYLAPLFEELAWHTYGTDVLRARFNLFVTSIIFAIFWVIWHVPLGLIKNYYQANLVESGWVFALNFVFSLFPFVIVMNWLYYKSNRNILIAIVFHISAGVFNEMFNTDPMSKVIQTVLLSLFTICLVFSQRKFFFSREN